MYEELWALLISNDEAEIDAATGYLAYYAAHLVRAIAKDVFNIGMLMKDNFPRKYNLFYPNDAVVNFAFVSHDTALAIKSTLVKTSPFARKVIPALISPIIDKDAHATGVVKTACMVSLASIGLGLIQWYTKLALMYSDDHLERILKEMLDKEAMTSLNKAVDIIGSLTRTDMTESWRWCRLIEDSAMADYSTTKHLNLCAICAIMTAKDDAEATSLLSLAQFSKMDGHVKETVLKVGKKVRGKLITNSMAAVVEGGQLAKILAEEKLTMAEDLESDEEGDHDANNG